MRTIWAARRRHVAHEKTGHRAGGAVDISGARPIVAAIPYGEWPAGNDDRNGDGVRSCPIR